MAKSISIHQSGPHTIYVYLPNHLKSSGCAARAIEVNDVLEGISGSSIRFDVNAGNKLTGVDILSFESDRSAAM